MERELILKYNMKLNGESPLKSRELNFKRINNSFLFTLDDGSAFFISLGMKTDLRNTTKDKIVVRPRNMVINKLLSLIDQESMQYQLIISSSPGVPVMHLINAIFMVLRELKVELFCSFQGFMFNVIEDEKESRIAMDCDAVSDKEMLVVKSGEEEVFLLESKGEIKIGDFLDIIKKA